MAQHQDVTVERVVSLLGDRQLVVVSNRQPYSHEYEDDEIVVDRPAGGLTAALDPIMEAIEGTWVAWGSGEADAEVTDDTDCVAMPPESEAYDLCRVWLSDSEVDRYYLGFSNRVLWPVCHSDTARIAMDAADWTAYQSVNEKFADAAVEHCDDGVVWFQDYHFALAPRYVREQAPEATIAHFWHIPWPAWDVFQACPHAETLLDGLLANDLIGFHTDGYCRNFLECVEAATDATVDHTENEIVRGDGTVTRVRSFPIGIDTTRWIDLADAAETDSFWRSFRDEHDIADDVRLAVGVERLDYTKGIEQRLDGLEQFLEDRPEWCGELIYIQKASKSRGEIPAYRRLNERVTDKVAALNDRFGTDDWQPVVYLEEMLPPAGIAALYREADLALVTPVRDGMNLVAKEFVASQQDDPGVLVLSQLAGASEQLGEDARLVHPYDPESIASGIADAVSMSIAERRERAAAMHRTVYENDVFAWLESQFQAISRIDRPVEPTTELTT